MYNKRIAEIFSEIGEMIELEDEKRIFEVRAYKKASLTLENMQEDVGDILNKEGMKGLMELPGIGKSLAEKIKEFIETGKIKKYDDYKKKYPIDLGSLTRIQGLGAKRAFRLYKELGVKDIESLRSVLKKHKIRELQGFGEKSESEIEKGLLRFDAGKGRMLLGTALPEAERLLKELRNSGVIERAELAGSARRMKETVGDLDIIAITKNPRKASDFISRLKEVESVDLSGPTKITVRLGIGLNCDIRIMSRESFGAAMQYFIGNKDHNVALRQIAIKKGYKLNEYGLFDKKGKSVAGEDESKIYAKLGLDYMEPEMRENRGEIELAAEHKIPRLVQLGDIKGDLHLHTTFSDGGNTVEEMAREAIKLGYDYIGFSDHSKSEYVAGGMDNRKYAKYEKEIEKARESLGDKIKILKSSETDILKDGSLDWDRKTLEGMDYVIAAIHSNLNMGREEMTKRLIKAIESNMVDIVAHPTQRLISERQPIDLDLDKVFEAAHAHGVVMEIDSFPSRLDLNDENIMRARKHKLKFAIDTDSHRRSHFYLMRYGVATAKRGWLTKEDVINTRNYKELIKFFKNK